MGRMEFYSTKKVKFVKNQPAYNDYFNNPRKVGTGVSGWLFNTSRNIATMARSEVGVKTGALKFSITTHPLHRGRTGLKATVGSRLPYAYYHHEGTRPHIIRPNNHKYLRFRAGGRIVYAKQVRHPGTRPNHYLTNPMRKIIR